MNGERYRQPMAGVIAITIRGKKQEARSCYHELSMVRIVTIVHSISHPSCLLFCFSAWERARRKVAGKDKDNPPWQERCTDNGFACKLANPAICIFSRPTSALHSHYHCICIFYLPPSPHPHLIHHHGYLHPLIPMQTLPSWPGGHANSTTSSRFLLQLLFAARSASAHRLVEMKLDHIAVIGRVWGAQ